MKIFLLFLTIIIKSSTTSTTSSSFDSIISSQCKTKCLSLYPWNVQHQQHGLSKNRVSSRTFRRKQHAKGYKFYFKSSIDNINIKLNRLNGIKLWNCVRKIQYVFRYRLEPLFVSLKEKSINPPLSLSLFEYIEHTHTETLIEHLLIITTKERERERKGNALS